MERFLELVDVRRNFGDFQALRGVTLSLAPGRVGLLGPNGAGKSTLLKILLGMLPPSSGTGTIAGQPIGVGDGTALRRLIGYMPEADALVPGLKGVEYVCLAGELYGMPRRQAQRRAHELLTYLELEDARYRPLEQYSLGMKQRIKLAQALVHDPPVLLLDEPTSGLDPAGRDAMLRLLKNVGRDFDKSILLTTHLLADVEAVCDQVVILLSGMIRGQGLVSEMCRRRENRWRLRCRGNVAAVKSALEAEGVRVDEDIRNGDWHILTPEAWPTGQFFSVAAEHASAVTRLTPDEETLEDLFLRTVREEAIS